MATRMIMMQNVAVMKNKLNLTEKLIYLWVEWGMMAILPLMNQRHH